MKKTNSNLTPEQKAEIDALLAMPEDEIDTSDIPEVSDWSNAIRGMHYRLKQGLGPPPRRDSMLKSEKRRAKVPADAD